MPATIDLTEAQSLTALRSVLLTYLGPGIEIIRAEINRVPEPKGPDFIVMTPTGRERLSTNVETYSDGFLRTPRVPGTVAAMQPTQLTVQLDIHGPASADTVQMLATLFRSRVACELFTATGFAIQPLYAGEAHQTPFLNAAEQFEFRWTMDAVLQANPSVITTQDFAAVVTIGLINVDAKYPAV